MFTRVLAIGTACIFIAATPIWSAQKAVGGAYAVTAKTRLIPPRTFQQSTRLARPGFRYPSGPALGTYGHAQEVVAKLMPLFWPLDRRSHCASPATAVFLGASQLRGRRPMRSRLLATMFVVLASAGMADAQNAPKKPPTIINPPPTAQDYADLAKLPDWSGVWNPKITDQDDQARTNPPPWSEKGAKEVGKMWAQAKAGRPKLIFYGCFPEAHPSWMLVTHNAMEILFTPGRVTMLGESDGNRLRRIYTDGRPHPDTPDPTFHGHSIGHWEGDTLVVDTVDIYARWATTGKRRMRTAITSSSRSRRLSGAISWRRNNPATGSIS